MTTLMHNTVPNVFFEPLRPSDKDIADDDGDDGHSQDGDDDDGDDGGDCVI